MRNLPRHVQESAGFARQVRRKVHTRMQLVNHEVWKLRRDESGLVPWKIRLSDDAVAGEGRHQLTCVRIAFGPLATISDDVEQVPVPVVHPADEPEPMAITVLVEEAGVVPLTTVELADHVHGVRV